MHRSTMYRGDVECWLAVTEEKLSSMASSASLCTLSSVQPETQARCLSKISETPNSLLRGRLPRSGSRAVLYMDSNGVLPTSEDSRNDAPHRDESTRCIALQWFWLQMVVGLHVEALASSLDRRFWIQEKRRPSGIGGFERHLTLPKLAWRPQAPHPSQRPPMNSRMASMLRPVRELCASCGRYVQGAGQSGGYGHVLRVFLLLTTNGFSVVAPVQRLMLKCFRDGGNIQG